MDKLLKIKIYLKKFKYLIHALIIISLVILTVPFSSMIAEKGYISNINHNSEIDGIVFLTPIGKNIHESNPMYREAFGDEGRFFNRNDKAISIAYQGFPKASDSLKLTNVSVRSGDYDVFGLRIGSEIGNVINTMDKLDYTCHTDGSNYQYEKGDITIIFRKDYNGLVKSFYIEVSKSD